MTTTNRFHPVLSFDDAPAAVDYLEKTFGFTRKEVHTDDDGEIVYAEMLFGGDAFGFSSTKTGDPMFHLGPISIYVVLDDAAAIDAHHAAAVAAGADVVFEPTDQEYGSRDYAVRDPEGNVWCFGTYEPGSA